MPTPTATPAPDRAEIESALDVLNAALPGAPLALEGDALTLHAGDDTLTLGHWRPEGGAWTLHTEDAAYPLDALRVEGEDAGGVRLLAGEAVLWERAAEIPEEVLLYSLWQTQLDNFVARADGVLSDHGLALRIADEEASPDYQPQQAVAVLSIIATPAEGEAASEPIVIGEVTNVDGLPVLQTPNGPVRLDRADVQATFWGDGEVASVVLTDSGDGGGGERVSYEVWVKAQEVVTQVELAAFPFLDQGRRGWISSESSDPNAQANSATYVIEFDRTICTRKKNPSCGIEDNFDSSEQRSGFDIFAEVVKIGLEPLKGKVVPNIIFNNEGGIERVVGRAEFAEPTTRPKAVSFDPNAPVRFIILTTTYFRGPIPADHFSRGWGVDPVTKQLVIAYGSGEVQDPRWIQTGLFATLFEMYIGRGQRNEDIDNPHFIKLAEAMNGNILPFSELRKMSLEASQKTQPFRIIVPGNQ